MLASCVLHDGLKDAQSAADVLMQGFGTGPDEMWLIISFSVWMFGGRSPIADY